MISQDEVIFQPHGWFLEAARRVIQVIKQRTYPINGILGQGKNENDPTGFYIARIAVALNPQPIGIAHIYNRQPYANPEHIQQEVTCAVRKGWLTRVGDGVYSASQKSQEKYNRISRSVVRVYAGVRPISDDKLQDLNGLLGELVDAISDADILRYKPSFELDLRFGLIAGSVFQRICSKLSQILAYRDDAYLNAWMAQDVNGPVWEAFTCIYQGKANNAEEITNQLGEIRHYDQQTYQTALDVMVEKGWICQVGMTFEPTDAGIKVIAEVARSLNQSFYSPWTRLDEIEIKRMKELLETLSISLMGEKPAYGSGYAQINRTLGWGSVQWVRDKIS